MLCTSLEENDKQGQKTNETAKDPAGNKEGCTDENGKRREIGEEWKGEGDGCNYALLVSNST